MLVVYTLDPLVIVITLIALGIATLIDLRIREVPDTLSYGLIIIGAVYGIMASLFAMSIIPFLNMLIGAGLGFGIGALLYYIGQWGGGDAKLLAGIGALHGFAATPNTVRAIFSLQDAFMLHYLVAIAIAGGVYGLLYLLYLLSQHRALFVAKYREYSEQSRAYTYSALFFIILFIVLAFVVPSTMRAMSLFMALIMGAMYLLTKIVRVIEKIALNKDIKPADLVEGDWIMHDIVAQGDVLVKKTETGLSADDIETLRAYAKKHRSFTVPVREGIPFVPAFLIGYMGLLVILLIL